MRLKIIVFFTCIMITLSLCGVAYSHWIERIGIQGTATMGKWKANIRIQKTLIGSHTDPHTGGPLQERTNLIAIAADFPTRFELIICVENYGSTGLKNVLVIDTIKNTFAPREWHPTEGVNWYNYVPDGGGWDGIHLGLNELTWTIGTLTPGEKACLTIWIETLQNSEGKFKPTSGDEGDSQDLEINEGATVKATSNFTRLSAITEGITIHIIDDETPQNGLGIIDTTLPYSTLWAADTYP
jgi:hypothetical protein